MALYPIGSEIVAEGFRWKVIGHKQNAQGQMVEDVQPLGPAVPSAKPVRAKVSAPRKNTFPRKIPLGNNAHINISRSGVSVSMQLAPGLSLITGGSRGTRLNVNMGPLRFTKALGKKKKGRTKRS